MARMPAGVTEGVPVPNGVVSLWRLLETCRAGAAADVEQAAANAVRCLATTVSPDAKVVRLHTVAGDLWVDGVRVNVDADLFTAVRGLTDSLQAAGVSEWVLAREVGAEALTIAAKRLLGLVADREDAPWPAGVDVERRAVTAPLVEPSLPLARGPQGVDLPDSHLQAVFLQHRLVAGLPKIRGIEPTIGKLVVQAVVERLLSMPGGLEPLMLLQRDATLLRRSTMVAVVATLFGRVVGWPDDRLAELGVAALLGEIGTVLDDADPRLAGFVWLLQRGAEDLWLRSALVATGGRDEHGVQVSATIVRTATAVVDALASGAADLRTALDGIDDPDAMMPVLRAAFAGAAA